MKRDYKNFLQAREELDTVKSNFTDDLLLPEKELKSDLNKYLIVRENVIKKYETKKALFLKDFKVNFDFDAVQKASIEEIYLTTTLAPELIEIIEQDVLVSRDVRSFTPQQTLKLAERFPALAPCFKSDRDAMKKIIISMYQIAKFSPFVAHAMLLKPILNTHLDFLSVIEMANLIRVTYEAHPGLDVLINILINNFQLLQNLSQNELKPILSLFEDYRLSSLVGILEKYPHLIQLFYQGGFFHCGKQLDDLKLNYIFKKCPGNCVFTTTKQTISKRYFVTKCSG